MFVAVVYELFSLGIPLLVRRGVHSQPFYRRYRSFMDHMKFTFGYFLSLRTLLFPVTLASTHFQDDVCNVQVVRTQHHHVGCTIEDRVAQLVELNILRLCGPDERCQIQLSNNPMTIVGHLYAAVSGRFYLRHGRS